ncbi:polysaccharide deacetylase family protein [Thiocystis violascens]|nr:polysaccharide deacetylase family protein [Thiocystis violascens]
MYHSIQGGRAVPKWLWSVAFNRFLDQIDLLRDAGWQFRRVSDLTGEDASDRCSLAITFDDGYRDNDPAFLALERRGIPATWFVVSTNVGRPAAWSDDTTTGWPMLDAGRLREMAQAGMEIGGHSRHHCRLAELPADRLPDEIRGCRLELEEILDRPVTSFAYPYGSYNQAVVEAVRDAGYRVACTTQYGPALADGDPLRMRRLAVYSHDTLSSFARKIGLMRNEATWGRVFEHLAATMLTQRR